MKSAAVVVRTLLTLFGVSLLLLGFLFWFGYALTLVYLHMTLGALLVLCLWSAAALALRARVSRWLISLVLGWSVLMPALGVLQLRLLPGQFHWLIRVLHLAVGVAAIELGHVLTRRVSKTTTPMDGQSRSPTNRLRPPALDDSNLS